MKHLVIVATVSIILNAGSAFAGNDSKNRGAKESKETKIAFVDFQRLSAESADGREASVKISALVSKKQTEIADKNKVLQASQQKLTQSGSVLSEPMLIQLQREIEQQTRDIQRFQQDAQADINELQRQLLLDFQKKILPLVEQVRKEKNIQLLLDRQEAGIVSSEPGLDISADVLNKLNATTSKPAVPKP